MGQFLEYINLITRTHEFPRNSLIYYKTRTDLMEVREAKVVKKGPDLICWSGQQGGLEGLRQNGWCVVN